MILRYWTLNQIKTIKNSKILEILKLYLTRINDYSHYK